MLGVQARDREPAAPDQLVASLDAAHELDVDRAGAAADLAHERSAEVAVLADPKRPHAFARADPGGGAGEVEHHVARAGRARAALHERRRRRPREGGAGEPAGQPARERGRAWTTATSTATPSSACNARTHALCQAGTAGPATTTPSLTGR